MMRIPSPIVTSSSALVLVLLSAIANAQTPATPVGKTATEDPVTLSPFEVSTDRDIGYAASSAMSATRTNEKLENLPNAISVLNQDLLQDIAANNFLDAVEYAIGAENIVNDQGTRGAPQGTRSGNQISFRGLQTFRQLRDGFVWYVPQDMFNTERIEVSRGPGGLAYGDVDTGGIINIGTKRAHYRDAYSVQVRYDNFSTRRYSIDANKQIVPKRLAFRLNAIERNDASSARQRTNTKGDGVAGALRWDVTKDGRTTIDLTYEHGKQDMFYGHLTLNDQTAAYVRGTGTIALDADPVAAGVQTNGVGMQRIAATGNLHGFVDIGGTLYNLQATATEVYRWSSIVTGANVATGTDPQNPRRLPILPSAPSLVPRGQDWGGPDSKAAGDWGAGVIELQHTFTNNFRVELTHNRQRDTTNRYQTTNGAVFVAGANARAILIDVNPRLPNPTGTGTIPNPRFEEYFISYIPIQNNEGHHVDGWRGTAVYDAKLPWGITQRIVVGASYRHEKYFRDLFRLALTQEEAARRGFAPGAARFYTNNFVYPIHYLRDGNSDEALRVRTQPGVTTWFRTDVNQRFDQSLTSGSFSALGSYFNGRLRTSLGISRDYWNQDASQPTRLDPTTNETRFVDAAGNFVEPSRVPLYPFTTNWVTNQTYGGVFKVTRWLALTGTYQETALFTDNFGTDLFGRPLKPRSGHGQDYGVRFTLLEDQQNQPRLHTSLTYYDNTNENVPVTFPATVTTEIQGLLGPVFAGNTDTKDEASRGLELEIVSNLTRNWTSKVAVSRTLVHPGNTFPKLKSMLERARAAAKATGLDPDAATTTTSDFVEQADADAGAAGMVRVSTTRWVGSAVTRYSFTQGALKGLAVGGSVRYYDGKPRVAAVVGGVPVLPDTFTDHLWTVNPFASYRRKIGRLTWTAQVNVNNLFDTITDQGAQYRYPRYTEPRQIIYTLTAQF
jgi:outer membrane receptor protein involved in Fe transport